MKLFFLLCFSCIAGLCRAQEIKMFVEDLRPGHILYASNKEPCAVSISLQLDLTNLEFSEGITTIFVIPAYTERMKLGELKIVNRTSRTSYSYRYKSTWGDALKTGQLQDYVYDLPYQKGKNFFVVQGYNGRFSHRGENAIDFSMPEGTPVVAAREGTVIKVVQHNVESCTEADCAQYNNYVLILHNDGSFSKYIHLKYNGSKVKAGDAVNKGDVIALSGNTGFSAGPHLHFVCFVPGFPKYKSLTTKFKVDDGSKEMVLEEKKKYTRDY